MNSYTGAGGSRRVARSTLTITSLPSSGWNMPPHRQHLDVWIRPVSSIAFILPCLPTPAERGRMKDRKSTRLNSSHVKISYAVFCLKKKISTQTSPSIFPLKSVYLTFDYIFWRNNKKDD